MESLGMKGLKQLDRQFQLVWLTRHRNCVPAEIDELTEQQMQHCLIIKKHLFYFRIVSANVYVCVCAGV
jgi:hypothetical protein